jgi:outer membrane lipoprotein-sorting protein
MQTKKGIGMKNLFAIMMAFFIPLLLIAEPKRYNPKEVAQRCIQRHGGWDAFSGIKDLYAKLDITAKSKKGEVESIFHEYFREPNKLRIEIEPLIDPPTKIAWNGEKAFHYHDGKQEETKEEKVIERLQESLRLVNLMILTNLFKDDTNLSYVGFVDKGKKSIHVVAQKNKKGERIRLYISASDYLLVGADFSLKGESDLFRVIFKRHVKANNLVLPMVSEVYRGSEKKPFMKARLRDFRLNRLANGNSFFRELGEKARFLDK